MTAIVRVPSVNTLHVSFFTNPSSDDESNNLTITSEESKQVSVKTTWTLLLYLTSAVDGCQGGETVFYPHDRRSAKEEIAVPPETGMLLLHKHGDDCMLVGYPLGASSRNTPWEG